MEPYYEQDGITIYHGDCREILPTLGGVTSVVTDPPYGLSFMGKEWDHGIPGQQFWELIGQACLPGAMCLAFGGTRTYHRLVCAIEDAGFEIRDCIQWIYGSGFPKSLDISKAIDKAAGAEREVVGQKAGTHQDIRGNSSNGRGLQSDSAREERRILDITTPSTEQAKTWNGYGTALKPAYEPICVAMKPLEGTFAANALEHGVAGINVDGCRVVVDENEPNIRNNESRGGTVTKYTGTTYNNGEQGGETGRRATLQNPNGRWPANIIHDGSDEVVSLFPETGPSPKTYVRNADSVSTEVAGLRGIGEKAGTESINFGDSGSAARFFYCAKESDREIQRAEEFPLWGESHEAVKNTHPTVKPIALMEYLVKLVTMPENNLILDPFCGSGSTAVACKRLGIECVMIEKDSGHCEIAANRLRPQ